MMQIVAISRSTKFWLFYPKCVIKGEILFRVIHGFSAGIILLKHGYTKDGVEYVSTSLKTAMKVKAVLSSLIKISYKMS